MSFAIFYLTGVACTALNALCFGWKPRWATDWYDGQDEGDVVLTFALVCLWPIIYVLLLISFVAHAAKAYRRGLVASIVDEVEGRMGQGGDQ